MWPTGKFTGVPSGESITPLIGTQLFSRSVIASTRREILFISHTLSDRPNLRLSVKKKKTTFEFYRKTFDRICFYGFYFLRTPKRRKWFCSAFCGIITLYSYDFWKTWKRVGSSKTCNHFTRVLDWLFGFLFGYATFNNNIHCFVFLVFAIKYVSTKWFQSFFCARLSLLHIALLLLINKRNER